MTVSGMNSSMISTLFSGLGGTSSSGTGSMNTSILSEYYNIRSGAYKKALTAYYASIDSDSTDKTGKSSVSKSISASVSSDSSKTLAKVKSSADDMKSTAGELVKGSAFKESDDEVYKTVSEFVDDYNTMIESSGKSASSNIKNTLQSLENYTLSNKKTLGKIGISIKSDGTLSLNKDELKSADMSSVESVFNGNGSYGYYVQSKASMISYYAENEASKGSTYTSAGGYSYNYKTGDIVNSFA